VDEFNIDLPNGITISTDLSESDVVKIPEVNTRDIKNGYVWHAFPPMEISGEAIVFNICFFQSKIQCINISISNSDKYGGGWSDFCEDKEKLRAKDTEAWLSHFGYPVGKYTWGEVWAGYDSKGGFGLAVVRYAL
jgi:hypothetical protein